MEFIKYFVSVLARVAAFMFVTLLAATGFVLTVTSLFFEQITFLIVAQHVLTLFIGLVLITAAVTLFCKLMDYI